MEKQFVKREENVYTNVSYAEYEEFLKMHPKTLLELFENRVRNFPNSQLLGTIVDEKCNYEITTEVYKKVKKVGQFLREITEKNDLIGLYSVNRAEWTISEYGGYLVGCPNVPLYSTFQAEAIQYVLEQTEMKVIFSSADKAKSLYTNVLNGNKFSIEHIVLFDIDEEVTKMYKELDIKVHTFKDIMERKSETDSSICEDTDRRPESTDIATICYTSGTSGMPKGVILTHGGFCAHIAGYVVGMKKGYYPNADSTKYISYLPLAHVFERLVFTALFSNNGIIGFYGGNPKTIQKDYEIVQPNFIVAVPRVLNLFQEKIKDTVNSLGFFKHGFFKLCLAYKKWRVRNGVYKSWLVDTLVFNKVKNKFGGKIESCLCGGSSINPKTIEYLQATLCMKIFQGYGLTEGLAANIVQPLECTNMNTVGVPFVSCKVKLSPVDGYPEENCGEILLNGISITNGYYKAEDKNDTLFVTIDGEKWLRTGDVAKFENDRFYCIGRVKDLFKTSYGEYIVPETVENAFSMDGVEDIFVTGTKYSDNLCAVVVVTKPELQDENKMLEKIKEYGLELARQRKITKYEIPASIIISKKPFTELDDGNLITPSFKKRRNRLYAYFKSEIEEKMNKSE